MLDFTAGRDKIELEKEVGIMKIGETILKLREEKKMSQEEFAQYYHVTRQTISNWEKEKNYPDLQTLVKISDE